MTDKHTNKLYHITGPGCSAIAWSLMDSEAITCNEIVALISNVTSKDIVYEEIEEQELIKSMTAEGYPGTTLFCE